jgi:ATP-binding cassette subfamily B protein
VLEPGRGPHLELRELAFSYPDDPARTVLEGVSVAIPAGSVVGVFGRTGSGKSTLLNLLARLYNPPPGTVFVDGADVVTLDLEQWRERLAVVPQRPFLFSDSVDSNVSLDEEADDERVQRAVRLAALEQDLEVLPDGIDTVVGERGIMLSGGQRQRVALARGLYRDADLLILDDVLSAVDHHTEAALIETIADLARGPRAPTVMIASHRLSALRRTDVVLVLDRGRLVDRGAHHELVERPGVYRDTWLAQRQSAAAQATEKAS